MKKLLLLITSLVLTLGLACPVMADTAEQTVTDPDTYLLENDLPSSEGWIQPGDLFDTRSNDTIAYSFKKTSSTSCKAQVAAIRPYATSIRSTISVQIKNGSTYNTITNGTAIKNVTGETIDHIAKFSISSRKTYRAKIAIRYVENGVAITNNYYVGLDSNGY